jgi:hypothetical protein
MRKAEAEKQSREVCRYDLLAGTELVGQLALFCRWDTSVATRRRLGSPSAMNQIVGNRLVCRHHPLWPNDTSLRRGALRVRAGKVTQAEAGP